MILDGAIDPNADPIEADLRQAAAFQKAFNDYAADCAKDPNCPLGTDPGQGRRRVPAAWSTRWSRQPRRQDEGSARARLQRRDRSGTIMPLYSPNLWQHLTDGLERAARRPAATTLLALADMYMRRDAQGHYNNSTDARVAVNCVDQPPITDRAKVIDEDRRSRESAPFMSYGKFTGVRADGHLRVLAGAADDAAARGLVAGPAADPRGLHDERPGDAVSGGRRPGQPARRHTAHLRGHPAHGGLPGRHVRRRHRRRRTWST